MDILRHDLRVAVRSLRRNPGFATASILCIALGIAANVFVWSPYNALVVRPLPYPDGDRVMQLNMWKLNEQRRSGVSFSYPDYEDLARAATAGGTPFQTLGAFSARDWNIGGMAGAERLAGARVTASLFPLVGLRPALGRFFTPEEDLAGKVMVIGYGLWQRKFGGDSTIVGRSLLVNGEPYAVIGVMQEGIQFPEREDVWLPIEPGANREHRDWRYLQVTGRLAPGATTTSANAWLREAMRPLETRFPTSNRGFTAWTQPLQEEVAGEVRGIFQIMLGAVGFVLLIACANVANLLLARGSARQREVAVRSAIGATRGRVIRQLLTESLLLALAGGALGTLIGSWAIEIFTVTNAPDTMPFWMRFDVDRTVLLVSAGLTALTGLLFGLAPALRLSATTVSEALKQAGGRSTSAAGWSGQLRSSLVVVQLSLSLVLLAGAALMTRSFLATQEAELGVRTQGLLTMDLAVAGPRYAGDTAFDALLATLQREILATPGVTHVGFTSQMPIKHCCSSTGYFPEGKTYPESDGPEAWVTEVTPGFFDAAGLTVLDGRAIAESDASTSERVAVIDEVFAQREWPGVSAVGHRFKEHPNDSSWITVVGVVRHLVPRKVTEDRRTPEMFLPLAQRRVRNLTAAIRSTQSPSVLVQPMQAAMRRVDPDLPVSMVEPMAKTTWNRMFESRVYGIMFATFGIAALVLAGIGLYGVISYAVAQRTHEMGIRMALGAGRGAIVRLVLSGSSRLVALGVLLGVPAAFGLSQLLRGALYGVQSTDPVTFVGIPVFLVLVALLASFIPARRASRVDPSVALRSDG